MTAPALYAPTPRRECAPTDPRVTNAQASLSIIQFVGAKTAADVITSAVQTDIESGIHRVQLYPIYSERRALTAALQDPGAVVDRYVFEHGQETMDHWQVRAILAVLAHQSSKP
jgi:hypothetical protein